MELYTVLLICLLDSSKLDCPSTSQLQHVPTGNPLTFPLSIQIFSSSRLCRPECKESSRNFTNFSTTPSKPFSSWLRQKYNSLERYKKDPKVYEKAGEPGSARNQVKITPLSDIFWKSHRNFLHSALSLWRWDHLTIAALKNLQSLLCACITLAGSEQPLHARWGKEEQKEGITTWILLVLLLVFLTHRENIWVLGTQHMCPTMNIFSFSFSLTYTCVYFSFLHNNSLYNPNYAPHTTKWWPTSPPVIAFSSKIMILGWHAILL